MIEERVLLVDDEVSVLDSYARGLRKQFQLDTASSARDAIEKFRDAGPYAVVVSDMRMPGMTGLELLGVLREMAPDTVRIMLTGDLDQGTAAAAVNEGAVYRFLNKPIPPDVLADSLHAALDKYRRKRLERLEGERAASKVVQLTQQLDLQSQRDPLTGLLSRRALEGRLQRRLDAPGNPGIHALCCIDLDRFHVVNDTCGYQAGDECLREVAGIIDSISRGDDLVARISANRFCVVFDGCTFSDAEKAVGVLQHLVSRYVFEWQSVRLDLTVSIGLVPISADDRVATKLLNRGEVASLVAKEKGGGQAYVASSSDPELGRRLGQSFWVGRIKQALRENRFVLCRQPIVPVSGYQENARHYEILVRMIGDNGEYVFPDQFLFAAERFMLSSMIDRWVIEHTMRWLSDNPAEMECIGSVSINLSGHTVGDETMCEFIGDMTQRYAVDPRKICFEITETAAIADLDTAVRFITAMRAKQFRFALDDFGTGLSSFAYLKNLPVDYLKIDGHFVKEMHRHPEDRAVVRCIHEVAQVMGKRTIAEYVEHAEIMDELREIGVDYVQGYLLGKPEPLPV